LHNTFGYSFNHIMAGDDVCLSLGLGGIVGPHIILFLKRLLRREIVLVLCEQLKLSFYSSLITFLVRGLRIAEWLEF